jgi:acetolactate synthase-1/2/3 large subunit
MNGAQALIRTLVDAGVDVCFMNPGTSEMHFVAALDAVPEMRGILALFEGVATGAADGFARMADRPASVLLHLGPGLGNGLANLHNARKGHVPVVVVVGDHATTHPGRDTPLGSDIATVAANLEGWVRAGADPASLGADAAEAVAAAAEPPGGVATLILPADVSWGDGGRPAPPVEPAAAAPVPAERVAAVAAALRAGEPAALLIGGRACRATGVVAADAVARATGARLLAETFPARQTRGGGLPALERLAYLGEFAMAQLDGVRHLILVDAPAPVSFFAYPGKPSVLVPEGAEVHVLAGPGEDADAALAALAAALDVALPAPETISAGYQRPEPALPDDAPLTAASLAQVVAALLPEDAIVSDESTTAGIFLYPATNDCPRHDWLSLTGGAIGQGLPVAVGAAVAHPERPVLALQADGSALYTIQALWTMAREHLDVTTVLINNRSYAVLNMELNRVGAAAPGPRAQAMLDLSRPDLDFAAVARGLGVPATRATTNGELADALRTALAEPGPRLIDAIVPPPF